VNHGAERTTLLAMSELPWDDTQDFEDVERGFLARSEDRQVRAEDGRVVWDLDAYAFLAGPAPDTVHPSLWRQSQLLTRDGLFEVVPGIYQLRGFDLSVMSVIEGDEGVVVIDPLISRETARPRRSPCTGGSGVTGRSGP
jgi:alkyl sulfatase BDS1-like metallo-beta-lactamase superfamily hydrolase